MTPSASFKILEPALHEQLECYRRLAKLAAVQHDFVQQGNTEGLLDVLEKRQAELTRAGELDLIVGPYRKRWKEYLTELDPTERTLAELLMADTRLVLEQIMADDRKDTMALQLQKITIGQELRQTNTVTTVSRGYAKSAYASQPPRTDVSR